MHNAKAIDKIRKLLALASNAGTPEEAATALAAAQREAARAALTEEEVRLASTPTPATAPHVPPVSRMVHVAEGQVATWRALLCGHLSQANGCTYLVYQGHTRDPDGTYRALRGLKVWGRPADVDLVDTMLAIIGGQVDALAKRAGVKGRTGLNNFRLGAVQVIGERVRAAATETRQALEAEAAMDRPGGTTALALRNLDTRQACAVAQCKAEVGRVTTRRTSAAPDRFAYEAGRKAGAAISLTPAKALR
jgi:hypothetical protein